MVALQPTHWLACAFFFVVFTCFVNSQQLQEVLVQQEVSASSDPLAVIGDSGDDVDVILIDAEEDPRGVVLRRWRRLVRNTIFRPGRYFRKIVAAMVIPGTIAGAIAGTVASSIVGVGAGGVTGGIAGAGLGGLGGILVPTLRLKGKIKTKEEDEISKVSQKHKNDHKNHEKQDDDDDDEDNDEDDDSDEDDKEDDDGDDDYFDGLGRNAPFRETTSNENSEKMLLLLRGVVNVDRLYELRNKMKLLKIKKKFKTKTRHYLWN